LENSPSDAAERIETWCGEAMSAILLISGRLVDSQFGQSGLRLCLVGLSD
jgi:hypothetical protein